VTDEEIATSAEVSGSTIHRTKRRFVLGNLKAALSEEPRASARRRLPGRQQLLVLQRRYPRPRLSNADRRFWILASRWFGGWRRPLRIVRPETILRWHRRGWRAYWMGPSHRPVKRGRRPLPQELRALIRRMPRKIGYGVKSESKPSWRDWGSRCPPEPSPNICGRIATEGHPRAGENS
jgi:hypothetical protein